MKSLDDAAKALGMLVPKVAKKTLIQMQSEISSTAVSPRDTGRFRSNWYAAKNNPERSTNKDTDEPRTDAVQLSESKGSTYYLSNNLPYAAGLAYGGKAVSQPKNWFPSFVNGRVPNIVKQAQAESNKELDL